MLTLFLVSVLGVDPILPQEPSKWSPAQLVQDDRGQSPSANLQDPKICGSCHTDVAAQWRTSAHAFASFNNPLYRVSVEQVRRDVGLTASRMCAGCHDLALLTDGAMDATIDPADPRGHAGITCTSCHSVTHATLDGNGSLTLRTDSALPEKIEDATVANHKARVANAPLRTAQLCAGCHRSFLGELTGNKSAFFGMDDFGAWQKSAFNGSTSERPDHVEAKDCRGCHMQKERAVLGDVAAKKGLIASHRFLGSHTTLAAMRGDAETLARVQRFLRDAVKLDLAAARINDGAWQAAGALRPNAGDTFEVDVVLFNDGVGHRFPGSVLDNQGTRIEVELVTRDGRVLAKSDTHQVRAEVVNLDGDPVHARQTDQFVSAVWNHTVPARDARAIRVGFVVPSGLSTREWPLEVRARVLHQTRLSELSATVCADSKKGGAPFLEATERLMGQRLDPCAEQPVTEVAAAKAVLDGKGHRSFDSAYRRGLALAVSLQEYLGDAEQAFTLARAMASTRDERGRSTWGLAMIAGRRGQTERALELLTKAEQELGELAATWRTRGDIYAQVWRWPLAAEAYRRASQLAPEDVTVWQALAMAEASSGRPAPALEAAQSGLRLVPRDADCLRVQALALAELGAPPELRERTLAAALQWRLPDEGPAAKGKCSKRIIGCADRRNPVPRYEAVPTGPLATGP